MNLRDIVLNYLTDNEKGMQQLITWFLNDVMNEEVAQQAGVPRHARSSSRRAHRNGYRSRSLKTRFGDLSLRNRNYERSRLRQMSSNDIPGPRKHS